MDRQLTWFDVAAKTGGEPGGPNQLPTTLAIACCAIGSGCGSARRTGLSCPPTGSSSRDATAGSRTRPAGTRPSRPGRQGRRPIADHTPGRGNPCARAAFIAVRQRSYRTARGQPQWTSNGGSGSSPHRTGLTGRYDRILATHQASPGTRSASPPVRV